MKKRNYAAIFAPTNPHTTTEADITNKIKMIKNNKIKPTAIFHHKKIKHRHSRKSGSVKDQPIVILSTSKNTKSCFFNLSSVQNTARHLDK